MEQTDYRTFEMRIFPIGPRPEQRVQIAYYQELDFDHDCATYVYPLATNTQRRGFSHDRTLRDGQTRRELRPSELGDMWLGTSIATW